MADEILTKTAEVLGEHRENYDSDCGFWFGCSCGWDNGTDEHNEGFAEHLAQALRDAGVLRDGMDAGICGDVLNGTQPNDVKGFTR